MVDRLGLGTEVRDLKLGNSFTNPKDCTFHTIRYDFKPASIDTNKMATIDVGEKNEIQVNFPSNLVFQGSAKPYQKQCVLIVNHDTGEITLEKLSNNISVKRQRNESKKTSAAAQKIPTIDQFTKAKKQSSSKSSSSHGSKSSASKTNGKTKSKTQNLVASFGTLVPKHSPLHASPNRKSPNPVRFSPNQPPSISASLPNIGSDDNFIDNWFPNSGLPTYNSADKKFEKSSVEIRKNTNAKGDVRSRPGTELPPTIKIEKHKSMINNAVGGLSDSSSSSSSSSGDSSDSSSDSEDGFRATKRQNGLNSVMPENLLKEDLQLSSESGSDSD